VCGEAAARAGVAIVAAAAAAAAAAANMGRPPSPPPPRLSLLLLLLLLADWSLAEQGNSLCPTGLTGQPSLCRAELSRPQRRTPSRQ